MAKNIPEKVSKLEKTSFILANLGNIPLMTLLNSFLLLFYTNVIGLNAAAVATLFLIAKLTDGLTDPIMGFILDHIPVGRMGRFRTTLLWGSVICGINYILLWFGPAWAPSGKMVVVYITYILLGITFDVMDISLNSMLPVMTDDLKERNTLSAIKGASYMLGTLILVVVAPLIVSSGTLQSYYILIFGTVAIVIIFSILGSLGIHERIAPSHDPDMKYGLKDLFKILTYRPVISYFVAGFIPGIGAQIGNAVGTFYSIYVLGSLSVMSMAGGIVFIGIMSSLIISPLLINKFGKKRIWIISTLISMFAMAIRIIDFRSIPILLVSSLITGISAGMSSPLGYGIQADNTNYVEHITGKRVEAAVASLSSFITKCSQGIGGAIPGYILAATGYINGASQQPQTAINGIIICAVFLPIVFSFVGLLVMQFGYNLDKKQIEIINMDLKNKHQSQ